MSIEFKLPDLGEGIHEGEIVDVLVSVGDRVEDGTLVLIVETDKATTEVPSPVAGVVREIRVKPGEVVKVGQVLMVFDEAGEGESPREKPPEEKREEPLREAAAEKAPSGRDRGRIEVGKAEAAPGEKEAERVPSEGEKKVASREQKESRPAAAGPVPAAPSTRRLARELGVDLSAVTPSGPGGRVMPEDVRAHVERGKAAPAEAEKPREARKAPEAEKPAPAPPAAPRLPALDEEGPVERVALRSIRKATARNMALAWSQVPHVTHQDAADITELEAFRRKHKEKVQSQGGTLSLTVFVLKAAVAALKAFPGFNSSLDVESQEILLKKYYHIGVAVDTDRGLIVPVIRDVDRKSVTEIALELPELVHRTREGKIDREDLTGGTFTLTNIGILGGRAFTPIVNYPQVAILGLGQARLEPVIRGDLTSYKVVPRLMLPLILGFDHRVVDGADAARFLNLVKDALEDPENLLMVM